MKASAIDDAVAALDSGRLVVFPTDTVYGLAGRADIDGVVDAIFRAKGRAETKPLPVLAASLEDLREVCIIDGRTEVLARRWWPGPLTLVCPRAQGFTHDLGGEADPNVAVRVPGHEIALEVLARSGPLAVTSANRSGAPPASTSRAAREALGGAVTVYVDGGRCEGKSSTVVHLAATPRCLREGPVAFDEVVAALDGWNG